MRFSLPPKQRNFLSKILRAVPYRAPAGVLAAFARNGWSTGDGGGHQLTNLGRQVAELSEAATGGGTIEVEYVDGRVAIRRDVTRDGNDGAPSASGRSTNERYGNHGR